MIGVAVVHLTVTADAVGSRVQGADGRVGGNLVGGELAGNPACLGVEPVNIQFVRLVRQGDRHRPVDAAGHAPAGVIDHHPISVGGVQVHVIKPGGAVGRHHAVDEPVPVVGQGGGHPGRVRDLGHKTVAVREGRVTVRRDHIRQHPVPVVGQRVGQPVGIDDVTQVKIIRGPRAVLIIKMRRVARPVHPLRQQRVRIDHPGFGAVFHRQVP